jgi:hypothetical protein
MQECPKCGLHYSDDLKICRTCGAILAAAAADPPLPPEHEADEETCDEESAGQPAWTCAQCGQPVPGSFEVCWNCGTSHDGVADPDFAKDGPPDESVFWDEDESATKQPAAPVRCCLRCDSPKLMTNLRVLDQGQYSNGYLQVAVDGTPDALLFKDRVCSGIAADICGECGHVELKAVQPHELYEHYLETRGPQGA